jgi:hypothetical protein
MSVYRSAELPTVVPRPIRQRPEVSSVARWLPRLILLPHTMVGLGSMLVALVALVGPAFSTVSEGHVVSEQVYPSKGGHSYQIEYQYRHGGQEYRGSHSFLIGPDTEPSAELRRLPGAPVRVRHFGVGAVRDTVLLGTADDGVTRGVPPLLFALFWNGVVAIFLRLLWYIPWRNRELLRRGVAAPGRVLRKFTRENKGTHYFLEYEYTLAGGTRREGSMQVSTQALWDALAEGQSVTVLHSNRGPTPSVVYEASDYEWAS